MIVFEGVRDILGLPAQTIVCPVNCVGVMGNGLALAIRLRWPHVLKPYKMLCRSRELRIGTCCVLPLEKDHQLLLLPTKAHYRFDSKPEYIDFALMDIADRYRQLGITELAIPAIGCGKGKLPYHYVRCSMDRYLASIPLPVQICTM
jgi:O-acetyl-ADP-ribose deacetylase (regulator of RNase III)